MVYTDGESIVNGTGLGLVLKSTLGDIVGYSVCCEFKATNNEAEYEALIMGLTTAKDIKIKHIEVNGDSLLIVNHVNGTYEAKDSMMATYLNIIKKLQTSFDTFNIQQIPREHNTQADALAGLAAVFKGINITSGPKLHIMKPSSERLNEESEVLFLDSSGTEDMTRWMQVY